RTEVSGLQFSTKYYARVSSASSQGEFGTVTTFTTKTPVSIYYILSPSDGSTMVPYATNVIAQKVDGASTFSIELNTDPNFDPATAITKTSSSRTIAFELAYNTTYYTRVS